MPNKYKQTVGGTIGAGMKSVFAGGGKKYYVLEHKVSSAYHRAGEFQEIIVDQIELGRDPHCQVRFDDSEKFRTVSRRHAAIVRDGDNWKLVQLSTTNKTFLNGVPVEKEWFLQNGDEIQLSVNGPKLGFIVPQGDKATTKSIGLSRRLSLFRQQALRPYKTAMWILAVLLVLAIGAGAYFIVKGNQQNEELREKLTADSIYWDSVNKSKDALIDEAAKQIKSQGMKIRVLEKKMRKPGAHATTATATDTQSGGNTESISEPISEPTQDDIIDNSSFPEKSNVFFMYVKAYELEYDGETYVMEPGDQVFFDDDTVEVSMWTATGFLLDDGKFVTAHHCVEGWLFAETKWDLYLAKFVKAGAMKVNAKLVAMNNSTRIELNSKNAHCGKGNSVGPTDYAWFQTDKTGGCRYDQEISNNLKTGTELLIYGFPHAMGVDMNSHDITPIQGAGTVAKDGLERGCILVGKKSFESGHSGSPVFLVDKNGTHTVVGIVSGGTTNFGMLVPISMVK